MTSRQVKIWSLITLSAFVLLLNLAWGANGWLTVNTFTKLVQQLQEPSPSAMDVIFWEIRLPRVLVASSVGFILGSSGVICQGLFRNPLASPSILGATSGAGLLVALGTMLNWGLHDWFGLPLLAAFGALSATGILFILTVRFHHDAIENLLLAGFALNAILAAMTTLTITFLLEQNPHAPGILYWLMGSFQTSSWQHVQVIVPATLFVVGGSLAMASRLDALATGELLAESFGVATHNLRWQVIVLMSIGVGSAVSIAGPIPFVGLMAPHLARQMFGPRHRLLTIMGGLTGMSLVLICDAIARTWRAPAETQVGILLALVGGPFFLWLWRQQNRSRLH